MRLRGAALGLHPFIVLRKNRDTEPVRSNEGIDRGYRQPLKRAVGNMELALVLRELFGRKRLLGLGVLVALVVALLSVTRISGFGLAPKPLQYSSASTQVLIDSKSTVLGNTSPAAVELTTVATIDANFMTSPTLLELIGKQVGLSGSQLAAAGPTASLPRAEVEPTAVERNVELTGEKDPYRLNYSNNPNLPIVGIDSQAPTTEMAVRLADAAATGLERYVTTLQNEGNVPPGKRIVIRQLGAATGHVVDSGVGKKLGALVFVAVLFLWCVLMLVGARFAASWRASAGVYAARERNERGETLPVSHAASARHDLARGNGRESAAHARGGDALDVFGSDGHDSNETQGASSRVRPWRSLQEHAHSVSSRND